MNGGDPGPDPHDVPRPVGALPSAGIYVLLISLRSRVRLRPGRLGRTLLDEGVYAYVGSALSPGSLPKRVARHIVKEKKLRWHIDYLLTLPEANVEAVVAAEAIRRVECVIALLLMRSGFNQAIAKFGSSDCSCPSHLLKSPLLSVRGAAILVSSLIESLGLRPKVAWLR